MSIGIGGDLCTRLVTALDCIFCGFSRAMRSQNESSRYCHDIFRLSVRPSVWDGRALCFSADLSLPLDSLVFCSVRL